MPLFNISTRASKEQDKTVASKTKMKKRQPITAKGGGLLSQISQIQSTVDDYLGKYKAVYDVITTKEDLHVYLGFVNKCGIVAIDTETTGLDPMLDKIVGISMYTPVRNGVYIPINHVSYVTGDRVENQLTEAEVREELEQLTAKIIMFNASFDIRVIKNQIGVKLTCYWDCYLASRLMNENEPHKGLKALHQKYVLNDAEDEFKFDALFKGITFDKIPINCGYLYAVHDAVITYQLYVFQTQYLYYDRDCTFDDRNGMNGVSWVFFNIEMPCVSVVADMEDTGIELDIEYAHELSERYTARLEACTARFYELLNQYTSVINSYVRTHENVKIDDPINIASPSQIAILLYDILGVEQFDKKTPRGTGEDILRKISANDQIEAGIRELCKAILDYREVAKLISTYIDKLPKCVNPNDGRIHCRFNQYGADTGRFSSSDPNLQNIPSHNKDIRKMFKATDGYVLMSSDYSQQEPKVMTQMCGDEKMIQAYKEGKDLYAEIAALSFNTTYDNCLEFRPDGTTNPDGKNRRSQAKSILLGVLYGRGVPSIAEQLGTTTEKAQKIKDAVFKGFPAIPQFENDSLNMAWELGYVTTLWGRKRRLPDLQLPEFEFKWKDGARPSDDILNFDSDGSGEEEVPYDTCERYERLLRKSRPWDKRKIFEKANKEGIWVIDNGGKIADAERQCVNARIQGSAADMSKLAMIAVGTDERLKELGFRLLIPVHDELIAECPEENVKECAERFAMLMSKAAESRLDIPIKCDVEITKNWYGEVLFGGERKNAETSTAREFENELKRAES